MAWSRAVLALGILVSFVLIGGDCDDDGGSNFVPAAAATATPNPVDEGDTVTLDGSQSSDPEGRPLTYLWEQTGGTAVTIAAPTASTTTFAAPSVAAATELTFRLTVSDARNTASALVVVTVNNSAEAEPRLEATAFPNPADEGQIVTLDASGSTDPDGQPLTYEWVQTAGPPVFMADRYVPIATFTAPPVTQDTVLTFVLTVSDGSFSPSMVVSVTVRNVNRAPIATATALPNPAFEGQVVTLDASGSTDPDGEPLTFEWVQKAGPSVYMASRYVPVASFTVPEVVQNVDLVFQLKVFDGVLASSTSLVVTVFNVNRAPRPEVNASPNPVRRGQVVTLDGSASADPDGDPITYAWSQTGGTSVVIADPTAATTTFTAPNVNQTTTLTFELTVSDGSLPSVTSFFVTVTL